MWAALVLLACLAFFGSVELIDRISIWRRGLSEYRVIETNEWHQAQNALAGDDFASLRHRPYTPGLVKK